MFGVRAGSDDAADEVTNQCAHGDGCREENGSLYSIDGAVGVQSSGGGSTGCFSEESGNQSDDCFAWKTEESHDWGNNIADDGHQTGYFEE